MNNVAFRNKEEELERLVQEMEAVKNTIKEIGATVARIERHIKRAFDVPKPSPKRAPPKKKHEPTNGQDATPTISAKEAQAIFDDLSVLFDESQGDAIKDRLQKMAIPDLRILANELGVTLRSRPSKKSLCSGIIGRLNERKMLSRNVNLTQPQSSAVVK